MCRPEAAIYAGLLGLDVVILKADHLHPEPVVYLFETLLQRRQLVTHKYPRHLLNITHRADIFRLAAHQLERHAVRIEQVSGAHLLDVKKIILRGDFTQRHDLDAIRFPVRGVEKQVFKIPKSFRVAHRGAQRLNVGALIKVLPHMTYPALTEHEVMRLEASDLILFAGKVIGFLSPSSAR